GAEQAMLALYSGFPAALHGQLAMIMQRMLARPGATLIHCTAGKDRTGFLVAILLSALGTNRDDVLGNYLQSRGRTNPAARAATEHLACARTGLALPDAAIDRLMSVDEAYLAASFAAIDREFAGIERYLLSAGITVADLGALAARLTG
ncbi:MAG: tyrosine-protein phosphatase, partial [Pseudomonadota bacterium]